MFLSHFEALTLVAKDTLGIKQSFKGDPVERIIILGKKRKKGDRK